MTLWMFSTVLDSYVIYHERITFKCINLNTHRKNDKTSPICDKLLPTVSKQWLSRKSGEYGTKTEAKI